MSIVTLQNSPNPLGSNPLQASLIKSALKQPLKIKAGSEVFLQSLRIKNVGDDFEVIRAENDTLVWILGGATSYQQKVVVLDQGVYKGDDLAAMIALKMNASTVLDAYKGNWTCSWDSTNNQFTIGITQTATPVLNINDISVYKSVDAGGTITNNNTDTILYNHGNNSGDDFGVTPAMTNILAGARGIFGNGGEVSMVVKPILTYNESEIFVALSSKDIEVYIGGVSFGGPSSLQPATAPASTNGWAYETTGKSWFFAKIPEAFGEKYEGGLYLGNDENITPDSGLNYEILFNPTRGEFSSIGNGGRFDADTGVGAMVAFSDGSKITLTPTFLHYDNSSVGFSRHSLYKGNVTFPGNRYASIDYNKHDIIFGLVDAVTNVKFNLSQMQQTGVQYPANGWNRMVNVFNNQANTFSNFTYGEDHLRLRIVIDSNLSMEFYTEHDDGGDGVFTTTGLSESIKIADTDTSGLDTFSSNIHESHYPLHPTFQVSDGGAYFGTNYVFQGIYDTQLITSTNDWHLYPTRTVDSFLTDMSEIVGAGAPLDLALTIKFGFITNSDLSAGFPIRLKDPNVANCMSLLGFENYVLPTTAATYSIVSTNGPNSRIQLGNIHVCLPQFDIFGIDTRGNISKCIGVAQGSSFVPSDNDPSILHFEPNFPTYISLNLDKDIVLYDFQVELKNSDGTFYDGLLFPSVVTLVIKDAKNNDIIRALESMKIM